MNQFRKHFLFSLQKSPNQFIRRLINFDNSNKVLDMNEAYFKHLADEQKIAISFRFVQDINSKKIDRIFNFVRDLNENVDVSLCRIKNNLEKEVSKKMKKKAKKTQQPSDKEVEEILQVRLTRLARGILHHPIHFQIAVELHDVNGIVTNKSFSDLLDQFDGNDYFLKLQQIPFAVKFNWPWINTLTLPTSILAGFYVYPSKLEFDFADRHASDFVWFRGKLPANQREDQIEWEEVGRGFAHLVSHEDIGYKLKVKATPKSADGSKEGPAVEAIGKNDVQAGPGTCPFECRHLFTMDRLSGSAMRVASYNLLADYYADTEDGRTKLFNYCPEYAIKIDYRKQLLLKEILGYNADIFCMQEVDFKVFDGDMIPFLGEQSMSGVHNKKGTTPEGLATFFRTDRFELIEHHGMNIGEAVKTHPACQELFAKLKVNEKLVERLTDRSTTVQFVILRSKEIPQKFIAVANTHLYFHPDADHIRLLQIGFSMILVQDFIVKFKARAAEHQDVSLIFCGDFNSVPECGIFKLMTEQFVPEDFIDWRSNKEQAVTGVNLAQPFNMQSACGTPDFTNYTVGFQACLDYIFYQRDKLKVTKIVEMPEEEELNAHMAIPSVVFPSDHVAIIAELEFV